MAANISKKEVGYAVTIIVMTVGVLGWFTNQMDNFKESQVQARETQLELKGEVALLRQDLDKYFNQRLGVMEDQQKELANTVQQHSKDIQLLLVKVK